MDDKYIFDKREMKKAFKKYGLIFLFAIPVLIGVNYFLNKEKNIKTKNVVETKEFEPKVENKKNKKTTVIVKNKEEK